MWLQRSTVAVISASNLHFLPKLIKRLWRKGWVSNVGTVALWQTQQTHVLLNLTLLCLWHFPRKVAVKTNMQIDNKDISLSHGDLSTASSLLARAEVVASDVGMEGSKTAPTPDQTKQTTMWIQKYFEPSVAAATRWPLLARATFISCPKLTWSVLVSSLGLGLGLEKCRKFFVLIFWNILVFRFLPKALFHHLYLT